MADSSPHDQLNADPSISTFTSALWFNAAIAVGCYSAFTILRHFRPEVYAPRSYLVDKERKPPRLPKGFLLWIITMLRIPDMELIRIMGLDRFMVLKFLRMGIVVFTLYMIVAIPILIPVNVINQRNSPGLNIMTMGNVKDASRTWAHLVLSVLLTAGVIFYTFYETRRYLNLRRAYLLRPEYANSVTARTLYVPSIPKDVNNVQDLAKIFNRFPGGIRRIWLTRNTKDLPDLVTERAKYVQGLEGAVTTAIKDSYKHYAKVGQQMEEGRTLIPEKLRPTHRVSSLPISIPFVGRKVDSITYYRDKIKGLNEKIHQKQEKPEDFSQYSSAFIEFNQQIAAHMAAQCVIHSRELQMAPRYTQIAPNDIIWENMNINSYERLVRRGISLTITTAIVIFWAIPVTFVQGVSSIQALSQVLPFLEPLNDLPETAIGIIQGILPAVALAILVALVPIIFRLLSTHEGIPQKSRVDLSVLHKYFFFMFVDVVLVSTIAGGIAQSFKELSENPLSIVNTLSENLPKASTFFITYVLLQSLNSTGQAMLQAVPLVLSYIFPLLKKTPRDIYNLKASCPTISLGTLIPTHTVIFVLGLEYSTIAPLILPFVCLFFYLSYFVYLYQFLYIYEMEYESGGLAFPRAIRHVYIGMYTWHLTMIGLFAVQQGAIGQLVIMVITLIVSCFALALYDKAFRPLFRYLPIQETEEVKVLTSKLARNKAGDGTDERSAAVTNDDQNSDASDPDKHMSVLERSDSQVGLLDAYEARQQLRHRFHQSEVETAGGEPSQAKADSDALRMMYDVEFYMHPSLYQTQPTVWLPEDDMGITRHEMDELKERKIQTSCYGARAEHAGKNGQKAKVIVDQEKIINGRKGVPGELPGFGPFTSINDNVRVFIDSYNVVEAMALSI